MGRMNSSRRARPHKEAGHDGPTSYASQREVCIGILLRFEYFSTSVCEAARAIAATFRGDLIVASVEIDHELACGVPKHARGHLAGSAGAEDVTDELVGEEGPDEGALGARLHLDARLVGEDDRACADALDALLDAALGEGREQLGGALKETGHRAQGDGDVDAGERLLEAVERDPVGAFSDNEMRDEARRVVRAIKNLFGTRRGDDVRLRSGTPRFRDNQSLDESGARCNRR